MCNFACTGDPQVQKLIIVAWHRVCSPLEASGLGFRALGPFNRAGIIQFVWDLCTLDPLGRILCMPDLTFLLRPSTGLLLRGRVYKRLFRSSSCMPNESLAMDTLSSSGDLIGLAIPFCAPFRLRMKGISLRMSVTSLPMGGGIFQLSFRRLSPILQTVLKGFLFRFEILMILLFGLTPL